MNVFVTGGTGVIGKPVVRLLVAGGHHVRVLSRNERNDDQIRELGGEPVRADLFDADAMRAAIAGSRAVLHLATRIPAMAEVREEAIWAENDRIRATGTRHVVDAAIAAGAEVLVYPSVTLLYPDSGDAWVDAETPVAPNRYLDSCQAAEAEVARFSAGGGRGLVLRMGQFYGPEASHTRDLLGYARKSVAAVLGPTEAYMSMIWVDDAARAVVRALEACPAGVWDVVDDAPHRRAELIALLGHTARRTSLLRTPSFIARFLFNADLLDMQCRSQRVSNRRFKEATGWAPEVVDMRAGFRLLGEREQPVAV